MADNDERRLLKKKTTSTLRTPWLSNVSKSIGGIVKDTISEMIPNMTAVQNETKKEFENISRLATSTNKKSAFQDMLNKNPYVSLAKTAMKNIASDIKTGNLNNKQREDEVMEALFGGASMSDFDADFSDDDFDFDSDMFGDFDSDDDFADEAPKAKDVTGVHIKRQTKELQDTTREAAIAIYGGIQKSTKVQAEGSKALIHSVLGATSTLATQQAEIGSSIIKSLTSQEASLASIVEFNNTVMREFITKATAFMEKRGGEDNSGVDSYASDLDSKTKKNPFEMFNENGVVRLDVYKDYVKKGFGENVIKNTGSVGMILSMLDPNSDMMKAMVANPIGMMSSMLIKSVIPEAVEKTVESVDRTIGSFFPALFMKLGQRADNISNPILKTIAKSLGFDPGRFRVQSEIDLGKSRLQGNAAIFDDVTKNSINNIIPKELFTQTSLLKHIADKMGVNTRRANEQAEVFDINTNRYIQRKDVNDNIANTIVEAVSNAWNSTDIAEALNEVIGNFKSESDQRMMGNIIREFKYLSSANPSFIDPTGNFNNKRLDNILKQIHAPKEMVDVLDKSLKNAVSQQRAMGLYQAVLSGSNAINETIDQISNNPLDYNLFVSDFVKNKNVGAVLNDYFKTKQDVGDTYFQIDARESNLKDLEEKYKDKGNFKLRVEELRNRIRNQSSASGISMTEQEEEQEIIRLLREDRKDSVGYKSNISSSEKDRLATIQSGRIATGEGKESGSGRIFGKNGLIRNMGQSANNLMYSIIFGNTNDVKAQVKEIGSQISSAIGEGITENAIKPVMKALFGSKKQILGPNGEVLASKREDGLFSGMMNKASDILHKVKYQIDGKEYHDSSGKLHEAKGDDYSLLGSAKSLVRNIYKDTASTVKSVLFGKDKVDENGEVVYQEQEVKDPKTGKITKKKVAVKDSRGIIGSTLKYVQDTFINRTDGWASNFFGTRTDENGNEVKRSFKMWLEDSVGKISDDDVSRAVKGGIIGGATFGAMGGSLLGNLVGGPFVGAALGSAVGFASKSEKFQNWLFGEEYTDSEGNKQRAGGLISQKMQNLLKNNKKSAVAGATLGALGGSALLNLLPGNFGLLGNLVGGPVGGAAIGLAATLFTKSDMFHEFLFGKKNEKGEILQSGVIDWWKQAWNSVKLFGEDEDEVKKAQQAAGFRAVGGAGGFLAGSILAKMGFLPAFLGPAGPIGGAMLGLAASIAHERGGIKKWLFGTKNPDDLPWVKVGILGQLKNMMEVNVVRPMVDNASIVMQNVAHVVKYEVLDPVRQAVYPLVRLSKRVLKTGARLVNSMAKRTFDLLDKNGAFHKVFGAIASIAEKMGENFVDKTVNGVLFPFRVFGKIASGVGGLASLIDAKISKDPKAYTDWKRERAERANEKRENKLRIQNAKRELKERQKNRKLIAKWTKNGAWEDTDENRAEANLQYRRKTGRDLKFYGEEGYDNSLERKRENQIARMSDDDVLKSDSNDPAIRSLRQQILMTRNLDDIKNILTNISSRFGGRTPFSDTTAKNIFDGFSEDKQLQGLSPRDALKYLKNKLKNLPDDATEEERNQINEAIEKARELIKKEKEKKKAEKEQKKEEEEKAKGQQKEDKEEQKRVLNEQKAKNKRYNDYVKTLNAELKKPLSRRDYGKIYQFVSAIKREKPDAKPLSPEDEIRLQEWMKKNGKQDYDLKDLTGDDFITRGLDKLFKRLFPGKNPGYATGTDSATPGFHEVGERGPETIVDRFGSLSRIGKRFTRFFEGGEQVYAKGEPIPVTIKSVLESSRNFLYDSLSDIQYRLFMDKSNEELKKQTSVLESIQGKVSDLSSRSSIDNDIGDDFDGEDEFKEKKTASIAQVGSIYADDGEEKEDIEGTYENQMMDKLEESREKKREGFFKTIISHLKGIKDDQKEHGFQWSSIFSKKGLITGGLLLLLPFLIKKLPIFGKILGGIFDLLGNVGGALVDFIGGIVKDKQWADENRTNTNGETAEEARKDNEKDMEALENFDVSRFILGEDGEWDHQSKGRSVFATNMVRATANIGKTKVAQKIGQGVSKLNDFESKIRDALSQKSLGTRVGEKVSKAKVVGGKALSSGKNLFNSVKGSASATLSSVKSTITNPNLTISGKIGELSSKATSKISSKIDALATKKAVGEAQETVAEKIIYKTISTLEDGIGSMVSKVASKIGGKGSSGGVKNALKGVFNWIKKKATIPKILGYLGNIFNIKSVVKIVTAPIRAVFADPFAAIIGAVDGATGAAKLFQIDKDNVDVKMIAISSVIGAISYTTIGSILMIFNDLFADEQGVSLVTHIANTIYDLVSNAEDEKILDSAQDSFKDSYLDYQENEVKKSFETYKKIHKDSDMTFEQYQALVDSGELSATYDSFADYNNDKNASIMDKAGKAVWEFVGGLGDKASDFFGKTKVTFKEDTKNNVYYKKESTDDKWIAYDATTGEEIGEVAESTIKEFSTKTYTKTIGWKTASDYAKESSFEELLEKEAQGNIIYYSKDNSTFFFLTGKGTFTEVNGNGRITTSALTTSEFYQEYLYNGKITKYTIDEDTKEKNVPKAVQEIFSDLHYDGTGDDSSVKRISKLYSANTTAEVDLIENSAIGNICYVDETGYIYYIYAGKEKFIKYDSKQGKILDRNVTSKDVNKMLNERTLKKHGLSSDKDQELIEIFKENNTSEELLSNEVNNKSSLYQSLRDALTLNATRDKDRVSGSTSTHNLGKTSSRSSSSRSSLRLNASSNSNTKSKGRFILGVGGGFGDSRTTTDSSNKVVATLPYYSQTDSRWSHMSYSNENDPTKRREDFGEAGCGPTALAMATNAIGSRKTPADYGKMALKYGYRDNTGTNWNFMTDAATDEGYYVNQSILPNADFIDEELSKGRPIVLSGMNTDDSQAASRSVFTKRGHYVTIVGKDAENNVLVQDPRGRAYSGAFPLRDVLSQTTAAWSFSRNKNDNTADNTRQKMLYTTSKNSIATPIRSRNLFMKAKTGGYGDQAALGMAMVQWMLCIYMRNTWVSGARNCGDGIGGHGNGDCSNTVRWALLQASGNTIEISGAPSGQCWDTTNLQVVDEHPDGVPNYAALQPGDLIYYKEHGTASNIAHVEMYLGNQLQIGHGSGTGPKISTVIHWCNGEVPSRRYYRTCRVRADRISTIVNPPASSMKLTYEQALGNNNANASTSTSTPTGTTSNSTSTTTPSATADSNAAKPSTDTSNTSTNTDTKNTLQNVTIRRGTTSASNKVSLNSLLANNISFTDLGYKPYDSIDDLTNPYQSYATLDDKENTGNKNGLLNYLVSNNYTIGSDMTLPNGVRNTMQAISQNNALIHKQSETVQAIINRMSDAGELDISNTKELNSLIQYLSSSEGARLIGDESAVDTNTNIRSNELVSGWRRSDLLRNIASSLTSSRSYKDIASTLFRNRNLSDSQRRRLAEEYVSSKYAGKTISDSKRKAEIQSVLNATNYTSNKRVTNTGSVFNPSSMTDWSSLIDDEKLEELKGTDDSKEKTENKKDTDNKKTSGLNTKAPSLEEAKGSTSSKKKKTGLGGFGELKNRLRNRFKKKGKKSKLGGYGDVAGAQMAAVKWFLTLYGHIIYSNDVNLRYNIDVALNGGVGNADCSSSTRWCYLKTLGVDIGWTERDQYCNTRMFDILCADRQPPHYSQLMPGDLVFYYSVHTNYVSHVGMYLGDNAVLDTVESQHCPNNGRAPRIINYTSYCEGASPTNRFLRVLRLKASAFNNYTEPSPQQMKITYQQALDIFHGKLQADGSAGSGQDLSGNKGSSNTTTTTPSGNTQTTTPNTGTNPSSGPSSTSSSGFMNGAEPVFKKSTRPSDMDTIGTIASYTSGLINRGFNGIISGNYDEDYDSLWNSVYSGTGSSGSYTSSSALSSSSTSTKKEEEKDSNTSSIKDPDKINDWADITKNNTDSDKKKSDSKKNTTSSLKLKADPLPTGKGGFGELNGATFVDQNDPSLKNVDYSDPRSSVKDTFGDAGCAPAALSMALGNIGIKEDPLSIAKTAQISGYRDETGTNAEFISNYLGSNGVNVVESEVPSSDFIDSSLDTGRSVILSGVRGMNENKNDSPYTSAGHYVTVVGKDNNGNYIVNDPRGKQYSKKYSKNSVLSSATSGWSLGDAASIGGFGERIRSKRKKKIGGYGDQKALGMAIVYWMFTVLDRLWYTNGGERYNIEAGINGTGSGDCSSTARWAVLKASGNQVDIGTYTGAQWNNLGVLDVVDDNNGGTPNYNNLLPGDLIFYKQVNTANQVAHVEVYVGNHKQIGHGRNWGRGVISGPKVSDVDAWCAGTAAPSRRYLRTCRVKAGVFSNVINPDASMMKITYEQAAGTAAPSTGNSGNSSSSSGNSTTGDASSSTGTSGSTSTDTSGTDSSSGSSSSSSSSSSGGLLSTSSSPSDLDVFGSSASYLGGLLNRGFNGLLVGNYDTDYASLWDNSASGTSFSGSSSSGSSSGSSSSGSSSSGSSSSGSSSSGSSAGGTANPAPAVTGDYLGVVSQKMESNNSSSYTCNPNIGPDGGATAGTWQFTYRWAIPGFWAKYGYDKKYPLPDPAVDYEGFKRQWLAAVNENPTQFFNNEHEHVINSYYEPVRQRAAAGGADPNRISRAAQESLLAGSIRLGQEGALRAWNSSSRDANYWQGYYPAMAAATASQGSDGGRYTDNDSYSEVRLIKGMLNQAPMAPPYRGGKGGFGERAQRLIDGTKTLKDYPIPIRESFKGFSESKKKFDELAKQSENGPGEFSKLIFSRPFAGGYGVNDAKAEPQAIHKAKIARVIAQNKERLRKAKNRKLVEARGGFGAYSTIGDETILQTLTSDHTISDLIMKGNILLSKQLDRLEAIATYLQSLVGISSETKEILESKTPITQQTGKASDPKRGDLTITKSNPTPPKHNNPDIDDSNASFYDQMNFELAKRIAMGR